MESTHLCQHLQASRKEPYGSNPFVGPNPAPGNPSMSSKQCGQLLAVYCLNQQHDHRPGTTLGCYQGAVHDYGCAHRNDHVDFVFDIYH